MFDIDYLFQIIIMLKKKEPFLIGVAGGISSGKSSVCKKIIDDLAKLNNQHPKHVLIISLDSFYKKLSAEELLKAERGELNLDHPDAYDEELAYETLIKLIQGKTVEIPIYDKKTYKISNETIKVTPDKTPDILILEGILVFFYPKIRDLFQMKLFVDCDADTRLARRVVRDLNHYRRHLDQILTYYQKYVKPTFEEFCLPTKKYADVIIPRGAENLVAINLIVQHLNDYLNSNSAFERNENHENGAEWSSKTSTPQRSPISSGSNLNSLSSSNFANTSGSKATDISSRPH